MMRALLVPYPGSFTVVGGHVTQIRETVRALDRAGASVRIGSVEEALCTDVDLVHFFGDVRALLQRGRPKARLVVSPIYAPRRVVLGPYFQRPGYPHVLAKRVRHAAGWVRRPKARYARRRDFLSRLQGLATSDLIVVNSAAERVLLQGDATHVRLPPVRVAYSGVAREAFDASPGRGRQLLGLYDEPFVLSVARIEPLKNTLALARALRGLSHRLVIIGSVLPGNERYADAVRAAAPGLIHVPHLDHNLVRHVHAAAAVHALPSWYDTTGLSTVEALAAGTPVVVGNGPCEREYFAPCAAFCRPASVSSVRRSILRALDGPTGAERNLARQYSWDRTARELLAAYAG